jgi:hypothetical protein
VYKKQARPAFPMGVPQLYADMAKECWDQESGNRPSFAALLIRLQVRARVQAAVGLWLMLCGAALPAIAALCMQPVWPCRACSHNAASSRAERSAALATASAHALLIHVRSG